MPCESQPVDPVPGDQRTVPLSAKLADSPWLWALIYSAVPLVAFLLILNKAGVRQSGIETRSTARLATLGDEQAAAAQQMRGEAGDGAGRQIARSLLPIAAILAAVVLVSVLKLGHLLYRHPA